MPCRAGGRSIFTQKRMYMEHVAKHQERHGASGGTGPDARNGGRCLDELVELIGRAATIELVRARGGTSFTVPLGLTLRGQEQREKLVQIIGREQTTRLIGRYGGTTLYVPSCRQAFVDTRDQRINRERDELACKGLSERALVAELAARYGLSDRQVWRILKKAGPVSPDMAPFAVRRASASRVAC